MTSRDQGSNTRSFQYFRCLGVRGLIVGLAATCLSSCLALGGSGSALSSSHMSPIKRKQKAYRRWNKYLAKSFGKGFKLPDASKPALSKKASRAQSGGAALLKAHKPRAVIKMKPGINWQWQLKGKIDTTVLADVYDIDLFDAPIRTINTLKSKGKKIICYFSAGSYEDWRPDSLYFPKKVLGKKMSDWNEKWLDVRQVDVLRIIMGKRLDLAAHKGCDAVEPDNVDGYTNDTGFPISSRDQIRFNKMLAIEAHKRGLAIGLKNDGEQARILEPWFDFAVVEQCFEYKFCGSYSTFVKANKAVLGTEYNLKPVQFCEKANRMKMDFIFKRVELDPFRISCRDFGRRK